jgi:hypothetical protein
MMSQQQSNIVMYSLGEVIERMFQLRHDLKSDPIKQKEVDFLNDRLIGILSTMGSK